MSEPKNPRDRDPSWLDELSQTTEQELDEALKRAATLASDLSKEVGGPESSPEPRVGERPFNADAEMAELDRVMDETRQALGGPATPSLWGPAEQHLDSNLPDFMAEFSAPTTTPDQPKKTGPAITPMPPVPESDRVAKLRPTAVLPTESRKPAPHSEQQEKVALRRKARQPARPKLSAIGQNVSPAAAKVCEQGVRLLEIADRPVAKVGRNARSVLGWIGLLFLAAAVVILLFAKP